MNVAHSLEDRIGAAYQAAAIHNAGNSDLKTIDSIVRENLAETLNSLTAWDRIQIARHPKRPHSLDYLESLFTDLDWIAGDRAHGDDKALLAGWGEFCGSTVAILAQQKGRTLKERLERNSGMMHPEGYRKAARLAKLAEKFSCPLLCFIDTPGAYAGIEAELRGQSDAIAQNLKLFSTLQTPIINIVIGEGCSGGALGIGIGDRLLMQEYSYLSTISPEGCASILFKSADKAAYAAEQMHITAHELKALKLIDRIIPESVGGAHWNTDLTKDFLKSVIQEELHILKNIDLAHLVEHRLQKILSIGHEINAFADLS
ncbi:MAG: acetyl-CoA carboxylase carboxyltransferase subunit alpha [Gammaproteobacteria bacterium]|nr:acetyl-CoA carboxylase carboxyltransferase subunit alpha [Gammaproteobacteria bacterium]